MGTLAVSEPGGGEFGGSLATAKAAAKPRRAWEMEHILVIAVWTSSYPRRQAAQRIEIISALPNS